MRPPEQEQDKTKIKTRRLYDKQYKTQDRRKKGDISMEIKNTVSAERVAELLSLLLSDQYGMEIKIVPKKSENEE